MAFYFEFTYLAQKSGCHAATPPRTGISGAGHGASRAAGVPAACTERALLDARPPAVQTSALFGRTSHAFIGDSGGGGGLPSRGTAVQRWHARDAAGPRCPVEHHLRCVVPSWIAHFSEAPWKRRAGRCPCRATSPLALCAFIFASCLSPFC